MTAYTWANLYDGIMARRAEKRAGLESRDRLMGAFEEVARGLADWVYPFDYLKPL